MKNKNNLTKALCILTSTVMAFSLAGCGSSKPGSEPETTTEQVEVQTEVTTEVEPAKETVTEAATEKSVIESTEEATSEKTGAKLPAYEYPGPEQFYYVLYQYLIDDFGAYYSDYEVCIPNPVILEIDDSDKSDIKVYGDFWINNYNLEGDTLMCVSGGSFPGIIHLEFGEEGYKVLSTDIVSDGSDFDTSAKEIFGDKYDAFIALLSDQDSREVNRAQIVANYVAANDLNITQYQDYGWDPVQLPEENIDNFYSDL